MPPTATIAAMSKSQSVLSTFARQGDFTKSTGFGDSPRTKRRVSLAVAGAY